MPDFDFQGHTVHYEAAGDGVPLVMLHCGGSSGRQWDKVGDCLGDGFRRITPDFYGFGATSRWRDGPTLSHDDQAALVAAVMEHESLGSAHVIGHSYGGACAVRLYRACPERVESLVLIEPVLTNLIREAGDPELHKEGFDIAYRFLQLAAAGREEAAWREFIDHHNGPGKWDALSERARDWFLAQTAPTADGFHSNIGNPTTLADCRRITVQTTILCSETTAPYNRRVTEILRDEIPGAEWIEIPGAGHMSPLTHPEAVAGLISAHLLPPARGST